MKGIVLLDKESHNRLSDKEFEKMKDWKDFKKNHSFKTLEFHGLPTMWVEPFDKIVELLEGMVNGKR
jgi:hypothetical protein